MHRSLVLSEADEQRLRSILNSTIPGSQPTPAQRAALESALSEASISRSDEELESRVGFHDRVSLVSPADSRDYYNLQIVMPPEADIDNDRIPVLLPVSLAVLGRRCGQQVAWETPRGQREMRIVAIQKDEAVAV